MPTPADETPPTPPTEALSSRASFASCPPEEEREQHAPREARVDTPLPDTSGALTRGLVEEERHAIIQEPTPTPEPESRPPTSREEKGEHVEYAGVTEESPSPVGSPVTPGESDGRWSADMPRYLSYPPLDRQKVRYTMPRSE